MSISHTWKRGLRDVAFFAAALGIYLLLMLVVLPRLGFST